MAHRDRFDLRSLPSRWRALPEEAKGAAFVALLVTFGLVGLLVALTIPTSESAAEGPLVETYTVQQVVTVRGKGGQTRTVVRRAPQVQRASQRPPRVSTERLLRTVTSPAGERVVTQQQRVPVVRRQVVTVGGETMTVVQTRRPETRVVTSERVVMAERVVTNERVVTDQRVVTNERVVTDQRVVTNERVVTDQRVVTNDRVVTVQRTETVNVPVTQTVRTVETVTVEETVTVPVSVTVTLPVTVTEQLPVTVTVTVPRKP